jgi:proline dehydrogenase
MKWFNKIIVGIMPIFPKSFIWLFSRRYIAGKTLADAVRKTQELNSKGCCATIDVLGEEIMSLEEATQSKEESIRVLETIHENGLDANLSVKLTSLGLRIDKEQCIKNVREIIQKAKALKNFVRIDMEDSTCTDDTLDIYRRLRKDFSNVGAVIQAYMKRSRRDVQQLIDEGIANLRICKGIYDEPKEIAFKDKEEVRNSFMELVKMMLETGSFIGIATHDKVLVERSDEVIASSKADSSKYEFQMLLGVTEKLRGDIVGRGNRMRVYVPYGEQWYGYCMRRLKENPQVAGHIIKNLFVRG